MNPYEVLQVPQNPHTTKRDIRHAYRKLAKDHHPDKGGNPEAFRNIQLAYEVLMDDAKRAHFDQTGEVVGKGERSMVEKILQDNFEKALASGATDPIVWLRAQFTNAQVSLRDSIERLKEKIRRAEDIPAKILGPEPNLLRQVAERRLAELQARLADTENNIAIGNQILAALKAYRMERDKEECVIVKVPTGQGKPWVETFFENGLVGVEFKDE